MGGALERGMVLAMSIWNDQGGNMTWLDTGAAGPCTADESGPSVILANDPSTSVTFSAIKWGDIGTTYSTGPAGYQA
jgi:cellulase